MGEGIRRSLILGVMAGLGVWHISLVGMLLVFADRRLIGATVTFSYVLLLSIPAITGWVAARRSGQSGWRMIAQGGVAGLASGAMVATLVVIMDGFDLRRVLVNATPQLVEHLTFSRGATAEGVLLGSLAVAAAGLAGGFVAWVPSGPRRVFTTALAVTLTVGLLADVLRVAVPDAVAERLFQSRALSVSGAILVFVASALLMTLHIAIRNPIAARVTSINSARLLAGERRFLQFIGVAFILTFPLWAEIFLSNTADFVGLYILMALGLNLVVGFAGLLDLGFVAFFAIGAYTMAVLTSPEMGATTMSFWAALPIAVGAALLAGILLGLPVLRMRGDYLAIATLGFGEIVRLIVLSDWLKPHLGGAQGVTQIATPSLGSFSVDQPEEFYYLILVGCAVAWFLSIRLKESRIGRSWMAIREDEEVAQAMGINRVTSKLMAFAIGASLGGLSGALFASLVSSVVPASFSLLVSINVLAVIIVGGMGSLPGVLVGALVLVALPELLREFQEFRLLVYGAVLVAMMLFRPAGLWPEATREREVEEATDLEAPLARHPADVGQVVTD